MVHRSGQYACRTVLHRYPRKTAIPTSALGDYGNGRRRRYRHGRLSGRYVRWPGGFNDALKTTTEMDRLYVSNNSTWSIPFDFGCRWASMPQSRDYGIGPIINTGIAHKKAASVRSSPAVRAPMRPSRKPCCICRQIEIDYE